MEVLESRYKILKTLGSGGMGTVYLAESLSLGTLWAIKAIDKKKNKSYDLLAEPNILKKLNHPALPRIVDIIQDDDYLYVIEDYIEGIPLDKQLQVQKSFDEATVIEWAKQLCKVLLYLHGQKPNPIIYRDMKPSNIIVGSDNRSKLIDFGIAREYKSDSGSDTSYMGTRGYAAPEQYGTSQTDERTDIYSLGVTMYHLLTGKNPNEPPYEFKHLRNLDKGFSEGLDFIVNKCVQGDPDKRYQNADELLHDLNNIYIFNSTYKKQLAIDKVKNIFKAAMLVGFTLLILAGRSQVSAEHHEKYQNFIEEGYAALNLYQFENALAAFNKANEVDASNMGSHLGIAQIFLKQAEHERAIEYLNSLTVQISGIHADGQFNYLKGTIYYEQGNYEEALFYLERAVSAAPYHTDYMRDLAVCNAKLGDISKARDILDQIVIIGTTDDVLEFVNAQVMLAEGNRDKAIEHFNNAIGITGEHAIKRKAYLELSDIYKDSRHSIEGSLQQQISILEQAVRDLKDEDDIIIAEMLAEAYFTAQRYEDSIEKFSKLLDIGYARPYIYANIAIIYQQIGDYYSAEETLKEMLAKYPDDYRCYLRFAFLYLDMEGEKPESQRDYKKVVDNYDLAVRFSQQGANNPDLVPLRNKIAELKDKGWI